MSKTESALDDSREALEKRITDLDQQVFRSIAQRREVSIEMGRAFNELKNILGHGKWQPHFEEVFAPLGLKLRTAERFMKRARKEDALLKNDSMSNFGVATDRDAMERREATQHAQAEVEAVSKRDKIKRNSRHIYRLPLRMTADEIELAETLQQFPDWQRAERKIVRLLGDLFLKYGVVSHDDRRHS